MTMTHPQEHTFHEYLDHALSDSEMASFEMHLESCAPCRRELEELKTLFVQIESIADGYVARDLSPAIVESLSTAIFKNGLFWKGIRVPLLLCALIVFVALAEILASIEGISFPEYVFRPGDWILENIARFTSAFEQFLVSLADVPDLFELPTPTNELAIPYVAAIALGVAGLAMLLDLLYLRSLSTQKEI